MPDSSPDFASPIEYAASSDVGMRRPNNQDAFNVVLAEDAACWQARGHLFLVADGMGAHAAGELASKLAVDNIPHLYHLYRDAAAPEALQRAIVDANTEIHRRGTANPDFRGMGTTVSVLALLPEGAYVGHVGDSRIYRLRDQKLQQLTFDHSLVWELRRLGRFAKDSELARSIPKNVITRSLGPNAEVQVDLEGPYGLQAGDTFLLCSDGLTGQVSDQELADLLAHLSVDEACRTLIDLADLRGGPDNITVVVVKVRDDRVLAEGSGGTGRGSPGNKELPPSSMISLLLAGVAILIACLLWMAEQVFPAAFLAVAGLGVLFAAGWFWFRQKRVGRGNLGDKRPPNHGPYAQCDCQQGDSLVQALTETLDELDAAARESDRAVAWEQVESLRQRAAEASASRRFPDAVRDSAAAIRLIMAALRRRQNKTNPHDRQP